MVFQLVNCSKTYKTCLSCDSICISYTCIDYIMYALFCIIILSL